MPHVLFWQQGCNHALFSGAWMRQRLCARSGGLSMNMDVRAVRNPAAPARQVRSGICLRTCCAWFGEWGDPRQRSGRINGMELRYGDTPTHAQVAGMGWCRLVVPGACWGQKHESPWGEGEGPRYQLLHGHVWAGWPRPDVLDKYVHEICSWCYESACLDSWWAVLRVES